MMRRTAPNGSGGTWSLQSLNSDTSSAGKTPSPDEMIWPSLMKVGPSSSNSTRSLRDSPAREARWPLRRSISHHAPIAAAQPGTDRDNPSGRGDAPPCQHFRHLGARGLTQSVESRLPDELAGVHRPRLLR